MSQTARTAITDYWRLDGAAGDLPFDFRSPASRALVPGDDMSMQVVISGFSDAVSDGGDWPDHEERYRALVSAYADHAGEIVIYDPVNGDGGGAPFTETHSAESLLVAIRPPADVATEYGAWALIKSMQDDSRPGRANVQLSLVYIAPLGRFESAEALRRALEYDGI